MSRPVTEKQVQLLLGMVSDLFITDAHYIHGHQVVVLRKKEMLERTTSVQLRCFLLTQH